MPPACKQQTLLLVVAFAGLLIASCTEAGGNCDRAFQSAATEKDEDGRRSVKEKDCECPDQAIACAGKDCKTFCSCSQGSCTEQSCPSDTLFNTAIGSCDAESNVACGKQSKPTTAPKVSLNPIPSPVPNNPVATPATLPALTSAPTPAATGVPPAPTAVTPVAAAGTQTPPLSSTATPVPISIPTTFAPTLPPVSTPSSTADPIQNPSLAPTVAPSATVTPTPSPVLTPVPSVNATVPAQNLTAITAQNTSLTATNASSAPPLNTTVNANTAVNASLTGNGTSTVLLPNLVLGPTPPSGKDSGSQTGVIIAVVVAVSVVAALLALGISVWCCCGQRFAAACCGARKGAPFKKARNHWLGGPSGSHLPLTSAPAGQSNPGFANPQSAGPVASSPNPGQAFSKVYPFSFRELQQATSNFSEARLLGEGGFGMVYYGRLGNGSAVAVKRATTGRKETGEQFKNEVDFLSRVHHRHLVELLGFCQENGEQMLVYELMAQGPLSSHLYGTGDPLSWQQRMKVALGAARGLEYLHVGADPAIVHRDIKTDNLLLDSDFDAKVADFGLSRLPSSQSYSVLVEEMPSAIKGTLGYLDPDYVTGNPITTKSDVYSFGVVLIQLISGRPAVDFQAERDCRSLVDWAKPFLRAQNHGPLMDPRLHGRFSRDDFSQLCGLAARCVERNPLRRPAMTDVVRVLEFLEGMASQIAEIDHGDVEIRSGTPGGDSGTSSRSGFVERSGGDQRLNSGFGNGLDGVHGLESSGFLMQSGFLWSRPPSSNSTGGHLDMDSYSGNLGELTMSEILGR